MQEDGEDMEIVCYGNGVQTLYGHLSEIGVHGGQEVFQGQKLGKMGYTGYVEPPGKRGEHLHFELRLATPQGIYSVNSENYIYKNTLYFIPIDKYKGLYRVMRH